MLRFFGRGAGFSDAHNSAFFGLGNKLVIMDCPLVTFNRLKKDGPEVFARLSADDRGSEGDSDSQKSENSDKIEEIIAVITHTHSDHIGGLALTIHFARFIRIIFFSCIAS